MLLRKPPAETNLFRNLLTIIQINSDVLIRTMGMAKLREKVYFFSLSDKPAFLTLEVCFKINYTIKFTM